MGSPSVPTPPPRIGKAGNLTVFITPPSQASTPRSRPSETPRSDLPTPTPLRASPALEKPANPPPVPAKVAPPPPPVQVPPLQFEKAAAAGAGKHDGSVFGFFWDAVARVQEAHASLDEYVANWFGLDQSKYQWALNDYYEATGKEVDCGKAGKPKEISTRVQNI